MLNFRLKITTFSYPSNIVNRPSPKLALPAKPKFGMDYPQDGDYEDYYDQESAYQTEEVPAPYVPPVGSPHTVSTVPYSYVPPVGSHHTVSTVPWSGPQHGQPPPQDDWVPPSSQNYLQYHDSTPASVGGTVMSEDHGYEEPATPMGYPEDEP